MQRTIVVGDVHGCLEELQALLREAGWSRGDRLVMVGDLVAKGPDSRGVLQLLREGGGEAVRGNHDVHALRTREDEARGRNSGKIKPERQQLLDTLTDADWSYLEALPYLVRLGRERDDDPAETVVLHAGAVPGVPLERQDPEHLITLRSITADGEPTKKIDGTPWAALWRGPERIIFGHDAVRGLQQYPLATGLDTGCVYGGRLTGIVLPERRLVSVPAKRVYAEA